MVNRTLLRAKAVQVLYAARLRNDKDFALAVDEMQQSVEKAYDMYHLFFNLLLDIQFFATKKYQELAKRCKILHQDDELLKLNSHPLLAIINNSFLEQLRANKALDYYCSNHNCSWEGYPNVAQQILNNILESDYFNLYAQQVRSYESDKRFCRTIVKNEFENNALIDEALEDISIYWLSDVDIVLSYVDKTIRFFKQENGAEQELLPLFANEQDKIFARALVGYVINEDAQLNELIEKYLVKWDLNRMAPMDIIIIKAALTEFLHFEDIPVQVTMNEYLSLASIYSKSKSNFYINGLLDNAYRDLKADHKLNKNSLI